MALLPPSSRIAQPDVGPTTSVQRAGPSGLPVADNERQTWSPPIMRLADVIRSAQAEVKDSVTSVVRRQLPSTILGLRRRSSGRWERRRLPDPSLSPHTAAIIAFQAQTATGKLNAVMNSYGTEGEHLFDHAMCDRSLAMVSPYSCLDRPTAKSHMSIISWTSPSKPAAPTAFAQRPLDLDSELSSQGPGQGLLPGARYARSRRPD